MVTPRANIDFESRSALDLTQVGAHLYSEHPTTRITHLAWSINDGPVKSVRLDQLKSCPEDLKQVILAGGEIHAWNAQFERLMWKVFQRQVVGAPDIALWQWRCTMVRAMLQGFPGALEHAGPAMGLGVCKDDAGHRLMLQMCKPRKVYKPGDKGYDNAGISVFSNPYEYEDYGRDIIQWWTDEQKLERLRLYCAQDVETEKAAGNFLDPIPVNELVGYQLDQRANDRGFQVDMELVLAAKSMVPTATKKANQELKKITQYQLDSVTKPNDIRAWINRRLGINLEDIKKETLENLLLDGGLPDDVTAVIELRLAAAKTSTAKLNAFIRSTGVDGRFRGGLQYAGAPRTNRWGGRRVQPHNFPRPPKWANHAVEHVRRKDARAIELLFGNQLEAISAILRACIISAPGKMLCVADYNAIEARIYAWLAGAVKILTAFANNESPYRVMAGTIFNIRDWRNIPKESDEYFLGKQIILGCGFGMGWKKFWGSCWKEGLRIEQGLAQRSIEIFRTDNKEVPDTWKELEGAAIAACYNPNIAYSACKGKITFYRDKNFLRMRLPSGRVLSYAYPRVVDDVTPWGNPCKKLLFWAWNGEKHRMEWQNLYGGRIMENAAQSIARDIILYAALKLEALGWDIILSVHDELLSEVFKCIHRHEEMIEIMTEPIQWAEGLPLKAEGYTGPYFRK